MISGGVGPEDDMVVVAWGIEVGCIGFGPWSQAVSNSKKTTRNEITPIGILFLLIFKLQCS
jgi:hypothetical protein